MSGSLVTSSTYSIVQASESYPILQSETGQIVLYNPNNHALSITDQRSTLARTARRCPYCSRPFDDDSDNDDEEHDEHALSAHLDEHEDGGNVNTAANYFKLLGVAHESSSRPATPPAVGSSSQDGGYGRRSREPSPTKAFRREAMAEGYFNAFFTEEARLGMGASGSVYLCQHVLNGNPLGRFAVKKIAIGESQSYLLQILREVRLLESLRHPNIITYHHSWLESARFSSFGPAVPTLHVLMQWAEGGSLDDYIDIRLGRTSPPPPPPSGASTSSNAEAQDLHTRAGRIRAFRAMQRAPPAEKERLRAMLGLDSGGGGGEHGVSGGSWRAVHLFSAEEVKGIFGGIVDGLAYLHEKSILHLDLKPGNVLLTWDASQPLVPRALLSDFGTSRDALRPGNAPRTGNTGTLEYTAPESVPPPSPPSSPRGNHHHNWNPPPADSKADIWSLGMVLHKLLFFRLPYTYSSGSSQHPLSERSTLSALADEVRRYQGFHAGSTGEARALEARRLSGAWGVLLEGLLAVDPKKRPSAERVLSAVRKGQLDPLPRRQTRVVEQEDALVPASLARPVEPELDLEVGMEGGRPGIMSHVSEVPLDESLDMEMVMPLSPSRSSTPTQSNSRSPTPRAEKSNPLSRSSPTRRSLPQKPATRPWTWLTSIRRTTKAAVLAAKVATLFARETRPGPGAIAVLLALAVLDNATDGLGVTLLCGLGHVGVLGVCAYTDVC
ncbi:kinase-like protein [Peniophora sp. CONT]|nr:kinase-like protein [Peniophora sp. CONT]